MPLPLLPASFLASYYATSPIVQRDLARFDAACSRQEPTATVLANFRAQYESLDRVLVVDATEARRGVNGVGNMFGDYVIWFAVALATRRALFIYWSSPERDRFDLSMYFTGGTQFMDWAWHARTKARVNRRWSGPHRVLRIHSRLQCAEIWRPLVASSPYVWVEIKGSEAAIAMAPMCDAQPNATYDALEAEAARHGALRTVERKAVAVAAAGWKTPLQRHMSMAVGPAARLRVRTGRGSSTHTPLCPALCTRR